MLSQEWFRDMDGRGSRFLQRNIHLTTHPPALETEAALACKVWSKTDVTENRNAWYSELRDARPS